MLEELFGSTLEIIDLGFNLVFCLFFLVTLGAAVAGIYRVAGKNMAPLEALVFGVGQTVLTLIISFSRILATL